MLYDNALAGRGGQPIPLDDETLATITGGDGPVITVVKEIARLFWECIKTGIDDVIAGAEEGYADAQES